MAAVPTNFVVTFDGDTYWLACDQCDDDSLHPIDAGDSLAQLVAKANEHTCASTPTP